MVLMLDLLRARAPEDAVPVFLPLSAWNPDTRLDAWMVDRLVEDFPLLARRHGRGLVQQLVDTGRVLPVLDGTVQMTAGPGRHICR